MKRSPIRIIVRPGRLIAEAAEQDLMLAAMLAAFDPKRHSGEVMAFVPVGLELLCTETGTLRPP